LNSAAYNQVDVAEREPQAAYLVNGLAVRNLAVACRQVDAKLVGTDAMADADPTRSPVTGTQQRPVKKERALASKTIAAVAVAFVLIAFGVSNNDKVPVDYLVFTRDSPLILVIAVSALLGALIGGLIVRRRSR